MDKVALGPFPPRPDVRGPALEEALPARSDQDDLRGCPGGPGLDVAQHEFGQRRLVQRAGEDDQDAVPGVGGGSGHDRVQGRLANRKDDDCRCGEGADRHPQARAPDVEAADDRQGDAGNDRRQLPGCQVLWLCRLMLGSIALHRLHHTDSHSQGSAARG